MVVLGPASVRPDPSQPAVCGGRFDAAQFQLVSPGYPERFPGKLRCEFEVVAASAAVCGLDVDLGTLVLPACPSELLLVAGRPLCGPHNGVVHVPYLQSRVNIIFEGSPDGEAAFNITVRQVECSRREVECGGQFSEDTVVIQSPGYPLGYPGGLDCQYTIIPVDPSICLVEVAFSDSALESSPNCFKDSLTLGMHRMCGPLEGVVVLSVKGVFHITFSTDKEVSDKGFKMTVWQKKCSNSLTEPPRKNEKLDLIDFGLQTQLGGPSFVSLEGYPIVEAPFPPFPLPDTWEERYPSPGYFPPTNVEEQNIPLEQEPPIEPPLRQYPPTTLLHNCILESTPENSQSERVPSLGYLPIKVSDEEKAVFGKPQSVHVPPFQQNDPQSRWKYETPSPKGLVPEFVPTLPSQNDRPYNPRPTQQELLSPSRPYSSLSGSFPFQPSSNVPALSAVQQCCGHIYSDSHFLIVSPDFPKSQPSDCIYTLSRFSPITNQLRLQFRYFLVGEDTGEGCSGGFLEIDGTRICGCKTGLVWTSQFFDSETAKILHLKMNSYSDKLINGFVIEVFQDDSYSQRYKRVSGDDPGAFSKGGRLVNVQQFVETTFERKPFLASGGNYPFQGHLVSDPSFQSWTQQTDAACLRWSVQNWPALVKTAIWTKYQCPANNDVILTTACRTCQYFCQNNCQCCRKS